MAGSSALFNQYNSLNQGTETLLKNRQDTVGKLRTKLENDLGINNRLKNIEDIRSKASDIQLRLDRLPTDLKNRTSGRLVTNAQLNRLTNSESQPLFNNLTNTTRFLGDEQAGLTSAQQQLTQRINDDNTLFQGLINQRNLNSNSLLQRALAAQQSEQAAAREAAARAAAAAQQRAMLDALSGGNTGSVSGASTQNTPIQSGVSDFQAYYKDAVRSGANPNDPAFASRIAQIAKIKNPALTPAQLQQLEKQVMASQKINTTSYDPFKNVQILSPRTALEQAMRGDGAGGIGGFLRGLFSPITGAH